MPYRGAVEFVHGTDGQGNVFLDSPTTAVASSDAAHFIIETVMADPGAITLVPLGPLTNIALAMLIEPSLTDHLAGIVMMGGAAFVGGNVSPAGEANILNDPEAADIVFGANCPIVMAGLDVTEKTLMTTADIARLATFDVVAALLEPPATVTGGSALSPISTSTSLTPRPRRSATTMATTV